MRDAGRLRLILLCAILTTVVLMHSMQVALEPTQIHQVKQSKIHMINLNLSINTLDALSSEYDNRLSENGFIFDCTDLRYKCKYLYPGKFFDYYFSEYIIDGKMSTNEQLLQRRSAMGLENENLPALASLSWWNEITYASSSNQQQVEFRLDEFLNFPRNLTYIHIHKCGGTSIQIAMARRASTLENTQFNITFGDKYAPNSIVVEIRTNLHHYKHSYGGGSAKKKEVWDQQRVAHIQSLYHPSVRTTTAFPIFTIIRDPIERFLSAVQQVMHYNLEFRSKCLKEPSSSTDEALAAARQQLIQCAIDDLKETSYRRDVHLLPMAAHFRLFDRTADRMRKDVPVSVFHMNDFEDVLKVVAGKSRLKSTTIHARDRSNEGYATSPTLSTLSMTDCSDEMIRQICNLYHIDYIMIQWLDFAGNNRCIEEEIYVT